MSGASTRALVLGGGGVTGVAWEIGLVHGLERRGIRLGDADHFVGTSAGSVASCAVPTVWPPVTIGSARYVDGGIRSIANVDLAAGHECVVVIAPVLRGLRSGSSPADQLGALHPSRSALVTPDSAAKKLMGRDTLDPRARAASARAGLEQADRIADRVRAVWG